MRAERLRFLFSVCCGYSQSRLNKDNRKEDNGLWSKEIERFKKSWPL
jgi:hypothetical protein